MAMATILVVDDDQDILDLLDAVLSCEGYRVPTAVNGEALALARTWHPRVILLDIDMPGMDRREISQRLRAEVTTADIPIILMSAKDRLGTTAATMPVNDWLAKPFSLQMLYNTVAHWCRQVSAARPALPCTPT